MLETIKQNVNQEVAGLEGVMLKKVLLAYYRGLYLDDTKVLIEITKEDLQMTQEDWNNLFQIVSYHDKSELWTYRIVGGLILGPAGVVIGEALAEDYEKKVLKVGVIDELNNTYITETYPFSIIQGDAELNLGENGKLYLQTTGMIQIFVDRTYIGADGEVYDEIDKCDGCKVDANRENCEYTTDNKPETVCYYKIKYYSDADIDGEEKSPLEELYNHYLDNFNMGEERKNYTEAVKDYLTTCYTYTEDGIKMYSYREVIYTERTWEYVHETELNEARGSGLVPCERNLEPIQTFPIVAEIIPFQDKIAAYTNPVEFMIDLMEITSSKEFLNAFIETVGEKNYIKMRLYTMETIDEKLETETKTRTTTILGASKESKVYTAKVVGKNKDGMFNGWNSDVGGVEANVAFSGNEGPGIYISIKNPEDKYSYRVKLYCNNNEIEEVILYGNEVGTFIGAYDEDNDVEFFDKYLVPSYEFTDISEINETIRTTTSTLEYEIAITAIKTWYAEGEFTNDRETTITFTVEQPIIENEEQVGRENKITIIENVEQNLEETLKAKLDADMDFYLNPVIELDRSYEWTSGYDEDGNLVQTQTETIGGDVITTEVDGERNIFSNTIIPGAPDTEYTQADCLNVQAYYTTVLGTEVKGHGGIEPYYLYLEYNMENTMTATDTNIAHRTATVTQEQKLIERDLSGLWQPINGNKQYYLFLGLLSNEIGEYVLGAEFKPVTDSVNSGKTVLYEDLHGGSSPVGERLVNGADILDNLLRTNSIEGNNLEEIANAMKAALSIYTTGNYSITDPDDIEWK